jgi:predicted enzyme related to lactoylglutathione lyase
MTTAARQTNPVGYFEVPVADMDRAIRFYSAVFGFDFERETIDGYEMALLPLHDGATGATGALAKGDVYVPSKTGVIIYFSVADIDATLAGAVAAGGAVLYPKKAIGAAGFVAEIEDSEGNRIALHTRSA